MKMGKNSINIQRLDDKAKRWIHHSGDSKRVLLLDIDNRKVVVTIYVNTDQENKERFNNNILMYNRLSEGKIPCPELLAIDESNLVFVAEYVGKEMPSYFKEATFQESKDKIDQAIRILQQMAKINSKQCSFIMPERIIRFRDFYKAGKYNDLPVKTKTVLGKFYDDLREIEQQNRDLLLDYGYGLSAVDFIDFLVDEQGKVSIIDFDELIEFYDFYYGIGYFFISLERTKNKENLQEYLLKNINLSRPEAEMRFKLGAIAALSNQLRISYTNSEVITQRLKEIYQLWENPLR